MNKIKIFIICFLFIQNCSIAEQTTPYYFVADYPTTNCVSTNGGVISTTINNSTGALANSLTPSFLIGTNSPATQNLTMSATAITTSGNTNAIFNIGTNKYIVLTNNSITPSLTSVTNINRGYPTASSNPNAIAYQVNDPTAFYGLTQSYNSTNKNWRLTTTQYGYMVTSLTIPATSPLTNTFSVANDEAGNYRATITLSF